MSKITITYFNPVNGLAVAERSDGRQYDIEIVLFEGKEFILTVYALGKHRVNVDDRRIGIEINTVINEMLENHIEPFILLDNKRAPITQ